MKPWRKRNPAKRREHRARYYAKARDAHNGGAFWSAEEIEAITKPAAIKLPDPVLAARLGRSLRSIHVKRNKLRRAAAKGKA